MHNLTVGSSRYELGFFGNLDHSGIFYRNVINTYRTLNNKYALVYKEYREVNAQYEYANFNFYLGQILQNYNEEINIIRVVLQLFNVPIILCGLYITLFSIRLNTKERQQEFLLLRSKGIPRKMIRRQFTTQSLMIGIIDGTVGLLCGIGMFYLLRDVFSVLFDMGLQHALSLQR